MTINIPDAQLPLISEFVVRHFGLHFSRERSLDLERAVCAATEEHGCRHDVGGYVRRLLSSELTKEEMEVLASHLTVGETYFFREKRSLEVFQERILPELIRERANSGRQIRIWSAGCATGEEAYSIAITLSKFAAALKGWSIEILATDVNTKSLHKASEGIYGVWSFRGTPPWVRATFFEPHGANRWVIVPSIRKMVNFAPLNLMDGVYSALSNCTGGLDVIFCRNVLMYFTPGGMRKVIRQFYRYLAVDGWLIVSPTETSHELFSEFATVNLGDVTLYRKSASRLPVTVALPECEVGESRVRLPESTVETPEPFRTSICHTNQEVDNTDADPAGAQLPTACYEQALGLYEQGRYGEAGPATDGLLSQDESDAEAMFLRARIHANQGKLDEALAWCGKAIAADKMAARAHYLRAMILQEQGSISEAIRALRQAVYAEPQFVLGHFALGNLALQDGRRKESEKHFENVLLLLAQYQPEDIVAESDGLPVGRLKEMIATPCTLRVAIQTNQQPARRAKQVAKFELRRR